MLKGCGPGNLKRAGSFAAGASMSAIRFFVACVLMVMLSGCGVFTPEKSLLSSDDVQPPANSRDKWPASSQGMFEFNVVQHIKCEIRTGLWKARHLPNSKWLTKLGAQVTLKLVVEDQSALNPNASFLTPLHGAETFTLGIGAMGSANATRTETIQFTYSNGELWNEIPIDASVGLNGCQSFQKGVLIDSDLKIGQFIYDKAVVADGVASTGGVPFSQLQFEINFVASFSGNITPTWKFTRTTVDGSGSLLSATRTDTDDVIITLGALTSDTKALHNAALIGSAARQGSRGHN
jgi:hypothetical protein